MATQPAHPRWANIVQHWPNIARYWPNVCVYAQYAGWKKFSISPGFGRLLKVDRMFHLPARLFWSRCHNCQEFVVRVWSTPNVLHLGWWKSTDVNNLDDIRFHLLQKLKTAWLKEKPSCRLDEWYHCCRLVLNFLSIDIFHAGFIWLFHADCHAVSKWHHSVPPVVVNVVKTGHAYCLVRERMEGQGSFAWGPRIICLKCNRCGACFLRYMHV